MRNLSAAVMVASVALSQTTSAANLITTLSRADCQRVLDNPNGSFVVESPKGDSIGTIPTRYFAKKCNNLLTSKDNFIVLEIPKMSSDTISRALDSLELTPTTTSYHPMTSEEQARISSEMLGANSSYDNNKSVKKGPVAPGKDVPSGNNSNNVRIAPGARIFVGPNGIVGGVVAR